MRINSVSNNINIANKYKSPVKKNIYQSAEVYNSSTKNSNKNISFSGKFLSSIFGVKKASNENMHSPRTATSYQDELSLGISRYFEEEIPPQNLKSIMSPDEFREILPNLKQENFISYNKNNRDKGIYYIDLDYHTNFSNGKENVFDILDDVARYANKFNAKTGKKFIFSITDRDSLEGVKHAVRIIGENPEKFKNVKFIPGIKMTFAHRAPASKLGFENSEMLVYGINPFSENLNKFIDRTIQKRRNMIVSFISKVNEIYPEFAYSVLEFSEQNRLHLNKDFTVSNLYWRAREYAESKGDVAIKGMSLPPEEVIKESEDIINTLYRIYTGSGESLRQTPSDKIAENDALNKTIRDVFTEYSTHYDEGEGKVISSAENLYNSMIETLSREPYKPEIAICAPFYLSHYFGEKESEEFPKVVEFMQELRDNSQGMLKSVETVVPSYNLDNESGISREKIVKFNDYIRQNTDFYEVGGSFSQRTRNSLDFIS